MKKTRFFKIMVFILSVLPISSLFGMRSGLNLWAQDRIIQYIIGDASDQIQTVNIEEYNVCFKKVRSDLIIVQLFVPKQKADRLECFYNSIYYSSLFAKSDSPADYLKKVWENTMQTQRNIDNVRRWYHEKKKISDAAKLKLKEGRLAKIGNLEISRIAVYEYNFSKFHLRAEFGEDPVKYFGIDKRPLIFVSATKIGGPGHHAISGRIEWVPGTDTKILFFSDSWYPTYSVIDQYAKEFENLVDALTMTANELKLGLLLERLDINKRIKFNGEQILQLEGQISELKKKQVLKKNEKKKYEAILMKLELEPEKRSFEMVGGPLPEITRVKIESAREAIKEKDRELNNINQKTKKHLAKIDELKGEVEDLESKKIVIENYLDAIKYKE